MMIRECWGYSDTSMPCQVKEGEALKTLDQLKENAGQRYVSGGARRERSGVSMARTELSGARSLFACTQG